MNRRGALVSGISLILLGVLFLISQFIPTSWPMIIVGVGAIFLIVAAVTRLPGLAIPGAIIGSLGLLLLWQSITSNWESWFYTWPLIPGAVGLGLVLAGAVGMENRRARTVGWIWLGEGVAFALAFWWLRTMYASWFTWPFILIGLGAMFLLAALLTAISAKAIPGAILLGLGLLLYWQNTTGNWASWAYTWPLIPGFVGVGLFLAGWKSVVMRTVGLIMLASSLAVFLIFAAFFVPGWALLQYWPVLLVLLGVGVLAWPLSSRRRR